MNQDGKFIYKREGCPETHYADGYYSMKHTSLFSNHKQKWLLWIIRYSDKCVFWIWYFYMSVTYNIKKEGISETVMIPGSEVSGHILVKLIADKLKLREN